MNVLMAPENVTDGELLLRPWSVTDASQIEAIASDPEIATWNPMTYSTAEQWCAERADWSSGKNASWAVVRMTDPALVLGAVALQSIDWDERAAGIGYWVAPGHRRQGVATRAVTAATRFAFERLELHRVHLFHAVENAGSCAVAVAAGFAFEGTHRQSYRFGDGRWHDEHSHARLSTDLD